MICVPQEVKDLYQILEHEFFPLDLAVKVQSLLTKISKLGGRMASASFVPKVRLSLYFPHLQKLAALRLLQQVSRVYQTIGIANLSTIIPFSDFSTIEKISVDSVKNNFSTMEVDYRKGAILFGSKSLESEGLQDHQSAFTASLGKAREKICPPNKATSKFEERLLDLLEMIENEHKRLLACKSIIETRKEEQECQLLEMEYEEETTRQKLQKITEEAEQRRFATEFEQIKKQRILRGLEERALEGTQASLQEVEKRGKKKGKKLVLEEEKITKQTLMEVARSEQLREKQEMEKKLQKLANTMDHLEKQKEKRQHHLLMLHLISDWQKK